MVKKSTKKGLHKPNNYSSQLFAYFYDELVSILIEDRDLLLRLTNSVTINLLRHPVDIEKIKRNSHSIIGSKMLANAVLMYLNESRHPDHGLICNLLLILESNRKLMPLVNKMRKKGKQFRLNKQYFKIDIATLFNIEPKEKICNVQLDLLLPKVHG